MPRKISASVPAFDNETRIAIVLIAFAYLVFLVTYLVLVYVCLNEFEPLSA